MSFPVVKRQRILIVVAVVIVFVAIFRWWRPRDQREVIAVTPEIVEQLVMERKSLYWGDVSDSLRNDLIAEYVRNEIVRHVAQDYGIAVEKINDPVRNRIIDDILSRSGERVEPSSDDLIAYYEAHKDRYRQFEAWKVMADMIADHRERKWDELRRRYRVEYADGVPEPSETVGERRRDG
jgi:hypothetical protein